MGIYDVGGERITNLGEPTNSNHAATKNYVDTHGGAGDPETINVVATSGAAQTLGAVATYQGNDITLSTNCTITMPAVARGAYTYCIIRQSPGGANTATFTGVKWPGSTVPTVTTNANAFDLFNFISDGTSWYGITGGQAFA